MNCNGSHVAKTMQNALKHVNANINGLFWFILTLPMDERKMEILDQSTD